MIEVKRKEMEDWIEFSMTESDAKGLLRSLEALEPIVTYKRTSVVYRLWDMLNYELGRRYGE